MAGLELGVDTEIAIGFGDGELIPNTTPTQDTFEWQVRLHILPHSSCEGDFLVLDGQVVADDQGVAWSPIFSVFIFLKIAHF